MREHTVGLCKHFHRVFMFSEKKKKSRELTKVFKQRLDKTGAVAVQTAVHVDVRPGDCSGDTGQKSPQVGFVDIVGKH